MSLARLDDGDDKRPGEPSRNRTYGQQIKSLLLYQLSYGPQHLQKICWYVASWFVDVKRYNLVILRDLWA